MKINHLPAIRDSLLYLLIFVILFFSFPHSLYAADDRLTAYLNEKALCNYAGAMEIIEEWTIKEKDKTVIEINIFRIYELIKYPELTGRAVNAYLNISRNNVIQNDHFLRSRIDCFLNILYLKKGNIQEASAIKERLGFISDFMIRKPDINLKDKAAGGRIYINDDSGWFKAAADPTGKIDISDLFENISNSMCYIKSGINIREEGSYILWLGKTGHTEIRLDGKEIFSGREKHDFSFDQYRLDLFLSKGKHSLVIKTGDSSDGIKLSLRLTDGTGKPAKDPGKDTGKNAEEINNSIIKVSLFNALDSALNNPGKENHFFNTGYLYYISGLISEPGEKAIPAFSKENDPALISAAAYYQGMAAKSADKKNQYFNRSIAANNKNAESISEIINIKLRYNLVYEAYPLVESIKEINPRSFPADEFKARIFISLGWDNEALKQAELLKAKGFLSCGYGIESTVFAGQQRFGRAIAPAGALCLMDRIDMTNLSNYIEYCLSAGNYEEAEIILNKCALLFPNNINLRLKLADIQDIKYPQGIKDPQGINSTGNSLPHLLSARKISPYHSKVLQKTGLVYHKLNKDDLALQFLSAASERDPHNAWIRDYIKTIKSSGKTTAKINPQNTILQDQESRTGRDKESFHTLEKALLRSCAEGDAFALYNNIEKLLFSYPADAESVQYYHDITGLSYVYGKQRAVETLSRVLERINAAEGLKNKNLLVLKLQLELEKLSYPHNANKEKNTQVFQGIRKWAISGPYLKYGLKDIDYSFMPEISFSFNHSGIKKKEINALSGELDISKYLYREKGIAYAASTINCENPVKIRIYSSSAYKLFINGKETIRNINSGTNRNCRILRVWGTPRITLMIKSLIQGNSNTFRLIVTDENDRPLKTESDPSSFMSSDFIYKEEMDYPYENLLEKANNPGKDDLADFRIGRYFQEFESTEAGKYYRNSLVNENADHAVQAFFLFKYMESSQNPAISAEYADIAGYILKNNNSIPATQIRLKTHTGKESPDIVMAGYKEISGKNSWLPLRLDYAGFLMKSNYEFEFEREIKAVKFLFPGSIEALILEAEYYRTRNTSCSEEIYKYILQKENPENSGQALSKMINICKRKGRDEDIETLIERYDTGRYKKEYIENLIYRQKYREARTAIFRELLSKDDPYYNMRLGDINYLEGGDGLMYWQKALSVNPSNFMLRDFLEYLETGRINNPFHSYSHRDIDIISSQENNKAGTGSAGFLNRNIVILISADGGSRIFSEDFIQYGNQAANNTYRIPFPGEIHPVRLGYYRNGEYLNIDFKLHSGTSPRPDNNAEIMLPPLENSILQIAYYINNPPINPRGSAFHSLPYIKLHGTNTPAYNISIKVITPKNMKINFFFNMDTGIKVIDTAEEKIYLIEAGSMNNRDLPDLYFSFSTMNGIKDLVQWYSGLLPENPYTRTKAGIKFHGKSQEEIMHSVYELIRNLITPGTDLIFSAKAADTLYPGISPAENKTILAASMLAEHGIKSYIALAGQQNSADAGFVTPESFANVLLYIPLDLDTELWMDFSDTNNKYGEVSKDLYGQDAVVIIKEGYELKKIK